MTTKKIRYDKITLDPACQIRAEINKDVVEEYHAAMKSNAEFPPLDVFEDDKGVIRLADGFHRYHAGHKPGLKAEVPCNFRKGSRADAIKFALKANAEAETRGMRRTPEDKRRAVGIAFDELEADTLSDEVIAKICFVSRSLVQVIRKENQPALKAGSPQVPVAKRRGADGKLRSIPPPPKSRKQKAQKEDEEAVLGIESQRESTNDGELDKTGCKIPPEILELWKDAEGAGAILTQVSFLRGVVDPKRFEKKGHAATIFSEVNIQEASAGLAQLYANLKRLIPYAVCAKCQGLKPDGCRDCGGRGFVSEFYWTTCVPDEKKKFRKKAK